MSRRSRLIPRIASLRRAVVLARGRHAGRVRRRSLAAAQAAPTAPPPVTILTSTGAVGQGDIFITPTGDTTTYANGPEILESQRQRRLVPRDSRG